MKSTTVLNKVLKSALLMLLNKISWQVHNDVESVNRTAEAFHGSAFEHSAEGGITTVLMRSD